VQKIHPEDGVDLPPMVLARMSEGFAVLSTKLVLRGLLVAFCTLVWQCPASDSRAADWTVTINTKVIEHCLDYPDSKLQPLIKASVNFEQSLLADNEQEKELYKHGAQPDVAIPPTLYEDIYSSHFRTIGLKRYKQLMVKPGTPGTIKITTSNSALKTEEANAAASSTIRVFLDLLLSNVALRTVQVPREIFDLFVQELQKHGFQIFHPNPETTVNATVVISIRSEPAGKLTYMSYGY